MGFLTPDDIRKVRLKGAEVVNLESLGKTLKIVRISAAAAFVIRGLKESSKDPSDLFMAMLQGACADAEGNMLTAEDCSMLLDALSLDEVTELINKIGANLGVHVGKAKGQSEIETSSTASASPSAGPTPTT